MVKLNNKSHGFAILFKELMYHLSNTKKLKFIENQSFRSTIPTMTLL